MTIPYLIDFIPYNFSGEKCQSIDDMVSISVQQRTPTEDIEYNIGSADDIYLPIAIKNITNNAMLEVQMMFDNNVFVVNDDTSGSVPVTSLGINDTITFYVRLNKSNMDLSINHIQSSIKLIVKNVTNGGLVTRDVSVSRLSTSFLDELTF